MPQVQNIRYGKLGKILFDYNGVVCAIREPSDVLLVGTNEQAARSWIETRYGLFLACIGNPQSVTAWGTERSPLPLGKEG